MGDTEVPSLAGSYRPWFTVGAAVSEETVRTHRAVLEEHFQSVTCENQMKWGPVHPAEGEWNFAPADAIVDFATAHGMKVRGHTLVWHNQVAEWTFRDGDGEADAGLVRERLEGHIATIMGRYRGRVYAWDVVNEAVPDQDDAGLLRPSPWLRALGPDYLAVAFRLAHQAAPDAELYYNDYNEWHPGKRGRIVRLVQELLDAGAPVHGVGLQGHWDLETPTLDELRETLAAYAALGVRLQVTELDVSLYRDRGEARLMDDERRRRLDRQAERFDQIFRVFKEYAAHLDGVTFWGVADDRTWKSNFPVRGRQDWPLAFDEDHRPKHVFWGS
jgi:endo-1,4-beta-xylanase